MDAQLIQRVQATKDHKAFEQLVQLYQSPVRQFLRKLLKHNDAVADELAQETFLKAFLNIGQYQHQGKFLSWLFSIAYRQFANEHRKKGELISLDETKEQALTSSPQEVQWHSEMTVKALMNYLHTEERASLSLHFTFGMTHQEIALVMDMPLGTVKSLIRRSKLKLKALLEQQNKELVNE